ncbi:hypothetical protein SAMN05421858_5043, partial [Haladaptatus litoreus]
NYYIGYAVPSVQKPRLSRQNSRYGRLVIFLNVKNAVPPLSRNHPVVQSVTRATSGISEVVNPTSLTVLFLLIQFLPVVTDDIPETPTTLLDRAQQHATNVATEHFPELPVEAIDWEVSHRAQRQAGVTKIEHLNYLVKSLGVRQPDRVSQIPSLSLRLPVHLVTSPGYLLSLYRYCQPRPLKQELGRFVLLSRPRYRANIVHIPSGHGSPSR